MINLTIDSKDIKTRRGAKILEAALDNGIDIPHMCYHPELKPFGGCRLCLVEVEGEPHLVSSCVTEVTEGMTVRTSTPPILRARKTIVQLLLVNHPLDCLVCERGGGCLLQKLAFDLKVQPGKYKMKKRILKGVQHRHNLEIDPRKCMHCGLCVRACKNLQYVGAIDFYYRGFKTEIGIPFGEESDCDLCGQCVELCPVAGVVGIDSKYIARPWEVNQVHTICPYCGTGCLITLNIKQNKLVKVSSDDKSGINEGKICVKGRVGCGFINSEDRLSVPLIKKDNQFQPVSWEEAITYTAERLKNIKDKYGSQAFGGIGSVKCPNEDNFLFQKFMRAVIGTNNIDNYTRLEHSPTLSGLSKTLGLYTANNSLDRICSADLIFIIGANPTESHPMEGLKIKKAVIENHSKLIVADPRRIRLVSKADHWLQLRPGTDLALLGGIIHIIIKESLFDEQYIKDHIQQYDTLLKNLDEYHSDRVAKITGVPPEKLVEVARIIAEAKSLAFIYSSGLTQHTMGTQNVNAMVDLMLLTGNTDREQSGIYPLRDDNNSQGACDMGVLPDYLPGYQRVNDLQAREKFEEAWGCELPSEPGMTSLKMFQAIREGKIKGLFIMGDNPITHFPNSQSVQEAMKSLDFLVVQDLFLSKSAKLADVVLPAASFAEREGTVTNMERRVQKIVPAIMPPNEALPDWLIISQLSTKLGYSMDYSSVAEIMEEINFLVPIYGGITYPRLEKGGLYWPCLDTSHPGTKFLRPHWDDHKKSDFAPLPHIPELEKINREYPYKLIIGGTLFHSGSGTLSMRSKILKEICPAGYAGLNPQDAEELGIDDNDMVRISSQRSFVEAKAKLVPQSPKGTVFLPMEFEELHALELMPDQFDPISNIPAMKVCSVNFSKV